MVVENENGEASFVVQRTGLQIWGGGWGFELGWEAKFEVVVRHKFLRECSYGISSNLFSESIKKEAGCGSDTSFWHESWVGEGSLLKTTFPRLYSLSENKVAKVAEMGSRQEGQWVLVLSLRRNFF